MQSSSMVVAASGGDEEVAGATKPSHPPLVDIGVNLTHASFKKHWREVVQRALDNNVNTLILTGTSVKSSRDCISIARTWHEETGSKNLFVTVGVHPHDAQLFTKSQKRDSQEGSEVTTGTIGSLRELLKDPLAVAVGECGLDFNRNFSTREQQIHAFREQVDLACELNLPMFVHGREAHEALIQVLDAVAADETVATLPPIVIHCFTGTREEALEYTRRGYYLGFTGTICKKVRGAPLREFLHELPLDKIMLETDAPFMGFVKGKKDSEPAHVVGVARQLSETIDCDLAEVCQRTTLSATDFFLSVADA
jgi:TatD family hydrolase